MWSNILWIWVCPYLHTDSGSDTSTLLIVSKNKTQIIPTCDPSLREQRKESGLCGTKCKCNEHQKKSSSLVYFYIHQFFPPNSNFWEAPLETQSTPSSGKLPEIPPSPFPPAALQVQHLVPKMLVAQSSQADLNPGLSWAVIKPLVTFRSVMVGI